MTMINMLMNWKLWKKMFNAYAYVNSWCLHSFFECIAHVNRPHTPPFLFILYTGACLSHTCNHNFHMKCMSVHVMVNMVEMKDMSWRFLNAKKTIVMYKSWTKTHSETCFQFLTISSPTTILLHVELANSLSLLGTSTVPSWWPQAQMVLFPSFFPHFIY